MEVYKFGGASVKDAKGVINLGDIIAQHGGNNLWVVVSAMGKTTNALEEVFDAWHRGNTAEASEKISVIRNQHHEIIKGAFTGLSCEPVINDVNEYFKALEKLVKEDPSDNQAANYDAVVSFGEMVSTRIVYQYLNFRKLPAQWLNASKIVRTDRNFKKANVVWEKTAEKVTSINHTYPDKIKITQGFVGGTEEGHVTTLGREGSDFSGAILAFCSNASALTIWKDVPGLLNADPRLFESTVKLEEISYKEALELSYYGASVIHPKTVKPLQNKSIPLYIKPFLSPKEKGSKIHQTEHFDTDIPSFIIKPNQKLLSISTRDFSFVVEEHLTDLFAAFHKHQISINLMQNSAISFTAAVDGNCNLEPLIEELKNRYKVLYNDGAELITIRHFNQEVIDQLTRGKEILVEQKTRSTVRFICK
ncbi:aspartate kinase [Luteibaculum oceani]|uniref:Aspartokinase n=1 Tax=Luteibaculum oceani TaxID=1294296 RepID=A0A5C6V9G6_9FLAO|nr:aspartate kinase [Luteibaculum oceani]TXC81829.1 aspartate kinase [Luteibaculum oceani]